MRNITILEGTLQDCLGGEFGPLTQQQFRRRLQLGDTGFIFRQNGCLAHHAWLSRRPNKIAGNTGAEAYLYDAYTIPRFRNRGIHTMLTWEWIAFIRRQGIRRVFVAVACANAPARRVYR